MEPHPLDGDNLTVTVTHVSTGLVGEASGVEDSAEELMVMALDDLLKKVEEAGGC